MPGHFQHTCTARSCRSFESFFWLQCTIRQYQSDLSHQSALEIRVRIRVRLTVALF